MNNEFFITSAAPSQDDKTEEMPNSAEGDDEIKSFSNEEIMIGSPKKLDLRINKSIKVPKMP